MVRNQGRVTRFVVMAVLQAARAEALGLPREAAYSWGLNRAIFYAAAKRGFQTSSAPREEGGATPPVRPGRELVHVGEEEAYRSTASKELVFTIGDQEQTVAEFERGVAARFGTKENFRLAWEEAAALMGRFDRATLASQRRFYDEVYKPRRDDLSDSWTQKYSPTRKPK